MNRTLAALGAIAVLLTATEARAQVDCSTLPNPVFMQIGDTQEALIKSLGKALRESAVKSMTLIYLKGSSCVNVDVFETNGLLAVNPLYIPSNVEDPAWTTSTASPTCVIDPGGSALDVGNSATYISSCTLDPAPAGVFRAKGPIQGYAFIVPEASTETVITAEEAYFVYGFPNGGGVTPWVDETFIMKRPTTASTLLTLMANINVPADRAKGVLFDRSGQLVTALTGSVEPAKTLGILGVEVADKNRATINILAFRAYDQNHAYYPDSVPTSFDKKNVRDGHYVPWSPTEWMYYVDGSGDPVNADAKYVVDMILGLPVTPAPDFDPLALVIGTGLVPECAMSVTRGFDGGELSIYEAPEPCGCFFESEVDVPGASCTACIDDSPCGAGACRHGFCEAR